MVPADSKSGARFEWVWFGPERLVLKYQDARDDWLMRATGDLDGRRFAALWESGLLDAMPGVIDHAVVGAAVEGKVGAILLRDVSDGLLPLGDEPLGMAQHLRFLDHMAALHARFWGWRDTVGLTPLRARYLMFSPAVAGAEAARGSQALVPKVMAEGWEKFPTAAPGAAAVVLPLLDDPGPLVAALGRVPHTLVHGDWKAANLGCHRDGRTILLDWGEVPGEASPLADLAWYLALNAARLPQSKEGTVSAYRAALEGHGIDTAGWWDQALGLELLGAMVQFGWEKAFGGPGAELDWWGGWAVKGAEWL
jgi:Phosphotransferase enzyme family